MPHYQGELDGLCGMYAVANAFEFSYGKDANKSFQACCESLASKRWPSVLWDGTYFGDVMRMISSCRTAHGLQNKMTVRVPFWKSRARSNEYFWKSFNAALDSSAATCALLSVEKPFNHWILATKHKSGLLLLDSTAGETLQLVKPESLYAGKRRPNKNLWRINPHELIIFETRQS